MADREPIAWITRGGKHIPIFDDGPSDDEKKKDREIEENKKQADVKNGNSTNYHLYRAGDLSGASTGAVYFSTSRQGAEAYSKSSSFKMQGQTYKRPAREVNEYDVTVQKPLVVQGSDALSRAEQAYSKLHPDREPLNRLRYKEYAKQDGYKVTGVNSIQLWLDKENNRLLSTHGYDSIVYKDYKNNVTEVIIPANSKLLERYRRK